MNSSKLLLFGEYNVLLGGDCLVVPFTKYFCELTLEDADAGDEQHVYWSNRQLHTFYKHLLNLSKNKSLPACFNLEKLAEDVTHGLWLRSNIPGQSGLGSSGALVAAVAAKYAKSLFDEDGFMLKQLFSKMESCFHGSSSGIDPLASFLNKPVAMVSVDVEYPDLAKLFTGDFHLFLVKQSDEMKTKDLITRFKKRCIDASFSESFVSELVSATNGLINKLLFDSSDDWKSDLKVISGLQLRFFDGIIGPHSLKLMCKGIESDLYTLKLLGSGGGFMLGFTQNMKETTRFLAEHQKVSVIPVKNNDLKLH